MINQVARVMARDLRRAAKANDAPIWSRLSELALKPAGSRRTLNLNKIAGLTKDGDVVAVPGKVLATGGITHKITLCPFSISGAAARIVTGAGGKIISFEEMTKSFPTGKGVLLVG